MCPKGKHVPVRSRVLNRDARPFVCGGRVPSCESWRDRKGSHEVAWAAMNPPPTDEDLDDGNADYIGSEPLDAALADRFPYIASVPEWDDLSSADQGKILADQFAGRHEFPVDIRKLVAEARARYEALLPDLASRLTPYVITLVAKLHAAHYDVSTRRATMLLRSVIAVHAARQVLARAAGEAEPDLYESARLALLNTLPDRARRRGDLREGSAQGRCGGRVPGAGTCAAAERQVRLCRHRQGRAWCRGFGGGCPV